MTTEYWQEELDKLKRTKEVRRVRYQEKLDLRRIEKSEKKRLKQQKRRKKKRRTKLHVIIRISPEYYKISPEYYKWRACVFKRDEYRCVECGSKKEIQAHHIESFARNPDLRFVVENGITLCRSCHSRLHPWIMAKMV